MFWVILNLVCLALWWITRGWQQRAGVAALGRGAALLCAVFSLLDWGLLSALRPLRVSFGPTGLAFFVLGCTRLFLAASLVFSQRRRAASPSFDATLTFRQRSYPRRIAIGLSVLLLLNLSMLAVEIDSFYVEPHAVGVTALTDDGPALLPDRPLRLVHLTDLHVERLTRRERDLPARVAALQPDLIVLTGDYLNQEYLNDPASRQAAREVLSQLHAPRGVYAVAGTTDPPEVAAAVFDGLNITLLNDEVRQLSFAGGDLYLAGVAAAAWTRNRQGDAAVLKAMMQDVPPGAYSLLLYHSPDLIDTAAELGINLYLAGHTHGGQIRLPFYGALITFSEYGKRYEMGRYKVGPTTLYVSRGIGLEGLGLPRMRFLCPPELEVISLTAGR